LEFLGGVRVFVDIHYEHVLVVEKLLYFIPEDLSAYGLMKTNLASMEDNQNPDVKSKEHFHLDHLAARIAQNFSPQTVMVRT
jgi:hypothetical protein